MGDADLQGRTGSPWWASRGRRATASSPRSGRCLYVPAEQLIVAAQSIAVRTSAPLADTAAAIRAAVRAVDPEVHVMSVSPLEELRQAPMARPRFTASLDRQLCRRRAVPVGRGRLCGDGRVRAPTTGRIAGTDGARCHAREPAAAGAGRRAAAGGDRDRAGHRRRDGRGAVAPRTALRSGADRSAVAGRSGRAAAAVVAPGLRPAGLARLDRSIRWPPCARTDAYCRGGRSYRAASAARAG